MQVLNGGRPPRWRVLFVVKNEGDQVPYGLKTSTEENRRGNLGIPTIYEQKSKLTMLAIGRVILNRSV